MAVDRTSRYDSTQMSSEVLTRDRPLAALTKAPSEAEETTVTIELERGTTNPRPNLRITSSGLETPDTEDAERERTTRIRRDVTSIATDWVTSQNVAINLGKYVIIVADQTESSHTHPNQASTYM